jgi:predicted DNA-binding ribbon-helix-helix protein
MKKISININGHNTSFSIENEFLDVLKKIAKKEKKSMKKIVSDIDETRGSNNLSSAIRLFVLNKLI